MTKTEIKALIDKYQNGEASAEERGLLESWYNRDARMRAEMDFPEDLWQRQEASLAAILGERGKGTVLWPKLAAVAAAVAMMVFGIWFFAYRENASLPPNESAYASDIAPGKHGATISLPTGEVIQLDSTKQGVIVGNGKIAYSSLGMDSSLLGGATKQSSTDIATLPRHEGKGKDELMILTASTAKGQTYEFTLPDGSKVWLNADSKISFPSQFSGKERKILLSGEGYFAVKHNEKQAFKVESKGLDGRSHIVEDIGTEFNISAYGDESSIKTTLVEGSAKVSSSLAIPSLQGTTRTNGESSTAKQSSVILKPNQQASLLGGQLKVVQINAEDVVAWKEGFFIFEDETLSQIMKRIARWYNVEVVYDKGVNQQKRYWGSVSRYEQVSSVLDILQSTKNIHFKIEGRRIRVMQ